MIKVSNIPFVLHSLIPLAERFGVKDDNERLNRIEASSKSDLEHLCQAVAAHENALEAWLAGSESKGPIFSDEYLMFSAMLMAADHVGLNSRTF